MDKTNTSNIIKGNEIDFFAIIRTLINGRKLIYRSILVCLGIAILLCLFLPVKYKATASLLPSDDAGAASNLGGLNAIAGMAGLNIGSMMGGNSSYISSDLYPQVVESYPFKKKMLEQQFTYEGVDSLLTLQEYISGDTIPNFGELVIMYTLKLPWTLTRIIKGDNKEVDTIDYGVINIQKEELIGIKSLKEYFEVETDLKSGLITISALDEEPILVAQKVQKALLLLQNYISQHRTKLDRENVDFLTNLYAQKEIEYQLAQDALFSYKDKHRNTIQERIDFNYQRLNDQYEISSSIFKSVAQQLEQAKITVAENTPAFSIIEPVIIPKEPYSPKKILLLVVSFFIGGFIGVSILFGRLIYSSFSNKLQSI